MTSDEISACCQKIKLQHQAVSSGGCRILSVANCDCVLCCVDRLREEIERLQKYEVTEAELAQLRDQVNAKYWEQVRSDNANLNRLLREKDEELEKMCKARSDDFVELERLNCFLKFIQKREYGKTVVDAAVIALAAYKKYEEDHPTIDERRVEADRKLLQQCIADSRKELAEARAHIKLLEESVRRERHLHDEATKAGTPYARERDAINSTIVVSNEQQRELEECGRVLAGMRSLWQWLDGKCPEQTEQIRNVALLILDKMLGPADAGGKKKEGER